MPNQDTLDNLTIKEARQLAALFGGGATPLPKRDHGYCIVIADRGHVFVGETVEADGYITVSQASVIRYWGTTRGIGELAQNGPTSTTKLDPLGEVRCPIRAVIGIVPSESAKWKR